MAGGNPEFYLGADIDFAPHGQLTSGKCGAFPHSAQPIVSFTGLALPQKHPDDVIAKDRIY